MKFHPAKETTPAFSQEQFNLEHISALDIVDAVASELGLELAGSAPKPALIKTNKPLEDSAASIKRELWKNPNLQKRMDATLEKSINAAEDPRPEQLQEPAVPVSIDDSLPLDESPVPESISGPSPVPEMPAGDQPETLPLQLSPVLKESAPEPLTPEGADGDSLKSEADWIRILAALILLLSFVAVDCLYALNTTPGYMLAVRLLVFAVGLVYSIATAWQAAGKKLAITVIIIFLFLFHFNNNSPVLYVVEKIFTHTSESLNR